MTKTYKVGDKKFHTGPFHIFNPVPMNEEEVIAHGNALAASGNYPVGTSACFNIGISGGCGAECFVYLRGECDEHKEVLKDHVREEEDYTQHFEIYPEDRDEVG